MASTPVSVENWVKRAQIWQRLFGLTPTPKKNLDLDKFEKDFSEATDSLLIDKLKFKQQLGDLPSSPPPSVSISQTNLSPTQTAPAAFSASYFVDMLDDMPNLIENWPTDKQVLEKILKGQVKCTHHVTNLAQQTQANYLVLFNGPDLPNNQLYLKAALWAKVLDQKLAATEAFQTHKTFAANFDRYLQAIKLLKILGYSDTRFISQLASCMAIDPNFKTSDANTNDAQELSLTIKAHAFLTQLNTWDVLTCWQLAKVAVFYHQTAAESENTAEPQSCETWLREFFTSQADKMILDKIATESKGSPYKAMIAKREFAQDLIKKLKEHQPLKNLQQQYSDLQVKRRSTKNSLNMKIYEQNQLAEKTAVFERFPLKWFKWTYDKLQNSFSETSPLGKFIRYCRPQSFKEYDNAVNKIASLSEEKAKFKQRLQQTKTDLEDLSQRLDSIQAQCSAYQPILVNAEILAENYDAEPEPVMPLSQPRTLCLAY